MSGTPAARAVPLLARRIGALRPSTRQVPEEVPVALSYGGSTQAVMMATPADLHDFALGFSLTEGIVGAPSQVEAIETVELDGGFDLQITLSEDRSAALAARRRHMAGPVGCGLCGIESLEQAVRPIPSRATVTLSLSPAQIAAAVAALGTAQPLHARTHAVHGAGFYVPGEGLVALREDVGRHNALDKLAGAIHGERRAGEARAGEAGAVVVTSRISVEMVQKTAMLGSAMLIAISAPTALAIRTAEEAGLTLVALARGEEFDVFTHSDRIRSAGPGRGSGIDGKRAADADVA